MEIIDRISDWDGKSTLVIKNAITDRKVAISLEDFIKGCESSDNVGLLTVLAVLENPSKRRCFVVDSLQEAAKKYGAEVLKSDYEDGAMEVMLEIMHSEACNRSETRQMLSLENTIKQARYIVDRECRKEIAVVGGMEPEEFDERENSENPVGVVSETPEDSASVEPERHEEQVESPKSEEQTMEQWLAEFPADFPYKPSVGDGWAAKLANLKDKHGHVVAFLKTKSQTKYTVRLTIVGGEKPEKKVIGSLSLPTSSIGNPVFTTRRDSVNHTMHNSDSFAFNYALVDYFANYRFAGKDTILRVDEKLNGGRVNTFFTKAKRLYDAIKTGEAHVEQHSNAANGVKYEPQIFFPRDTLKKDTEAYKKELAER